MPNSPKTYDFVISTLTLLEAEFWASVGKILRDKGYRIAFILFDETSRRVMHKNDFPYFNIHELRRDQKDARPDVRKIYEYAQTFGIQNIRDMFIHETLAYHRTDEDGLIHKTYDYLCVLDDIFSKNKINCIIQEMGGFAAYSCVFYAARKYGVDHLFYEPACLPGRIVFNLNSFYSDIPFQLLEASVSTEARTWAKSYIDRYCAMRNMVIPVKDRHLFRDMTLGRMVNRFNAIRLIKKLHHKYILREKAEFDELWRVFAFNVRKLMRRRSISGLYSNVLKEKDGRKYIYYPLHVPHDVQLTVRSNLFYFQEALIEYLSRILPIGYDLYIKEHPASVGALPVDGLKRLVKKRNYLKLLHPSINSFELVKNAEIVIVVNSKVGFEALMQGKKVIVVGEAFYKNKGLTVDVENLKDLDHIVHNTLEADGPDMGRVEEVIARIYEWSYPGELFAMDRDNHRNMSDAVLTHVNRFRVDQKR